MLQGSFWNYSEILLTHNQDKLKLCNSWFPSKNVMFIPFIDPLEMYLSSKQKSIEICQYLTTHIYTCSSTVLICGLFSGMQVGFFSVWRVHEITEYFCSTVCQSWLWKRLFGTWSLKLDFRKQEAPGKWCATCRDSKYTLAKPKFPIGPQSAKGEAVTLDTFTLLGADLHNASAILAKGYHQHTRFLLHPRFCSNSWMHSYV